jgi:hypothetical protein
MSPTDVVLAAFNAYRTQDLATTERLVAEDFRFTSPQDDRIDKQAFLERCFPTADRFVSQVIVRLVPVDENEVFLLYEYELGSGERYRNVEHITVRDEQLQETQVFFGGQVHD